MKKYHILIVEDDRILLEVLTEWFEQKGHTVTSASTVMNLPKHKWSQFDCIITDVRMPGIDGIEFTQLVRKADGPPVIVVSGYAPTTSNTRALEAGAVAFFEKPFKLKDLLKTIETYC
jgi:CheY-like chemotaxis protein